MKHLKSFNESLMEDRVDWYIKIAKVKYADKTADEIIDIIENGNESLRFNSEEEKKLFKSKWENVRSSEIIKEEFNPMDGIDNFLNDPTMIALATAWLLTGKYKVDNLKSWKNDFLDYCNLMGYTIDKEVLDFKFNQLIDKVKKIIKL